MTSWNRSGEDEYPFFIVVLGGGTLWHLQKFLKCIKYILLEFTPLLFSFLVADIRRKIFNYLPFNRTLPLDLLCKAFIVRHIPSIPTL
jgi:hypothetical protein